MPDLLSGLADNPATPLAERLRPKRLDEVIGQRHLLAPGKPLAVAFESGKPHSMILWGPPGSGKTTIARLMAAAFSAEFIALSAVLSGVKDIRDAVARAEAILAQSGRHTICVGGSNVVLASLPADVGRGARLRAGGWCTVENVYARRTVSSGSASATIRARSCPNWKFDRIRPVFPKAAHSWLDVACVMPLDARIVGVDLLWLQCGNAEIELKGCTFLLSALPRSLRKTIAIRFNF